LPLGIIQNKNILDATYALRTYLVEVLISGNIPYSSVKAPRTCLGIWMHAMI
jgi:hypothetical protein